MVVGRYHTIPTDHSTPMAVHTTNYAIRYIAMDALGARITPAVSAKELQEVVFTLAEPCPKGIVLRRKVKRVRL